MAAGGSTRAVVTALFANLGIAIAKFIGFLITRSSSMLAESIHSVADTSNQALLLLGGKRARKDANDVHQFGYGRERYFWSFVVALLLFSVGAGFAIYEGIEKIRHPHDITRPEVAVGILAFGIILESYAFFTAFKLAKAIKAPTDSWWDFIRKSRNPELPVVLLEDSGAMAGLLIALTGIGLTVATDNPVWDGVATLMIGLILATIAVVLGIEMKSLLIGEGAGSEDQQKIVSAINNDDAITEAIEVRTQHVGPEDILVVARLRFRDGLDSAALAAEIDDLQSRIHDLVPNATHIYIEPDLRALPMKFDAHDHYDDEHEVKH